MKRHESVLLAEEAHYYAKVLPSGLVLLMLLAGIPVLAGDSSTAAGKKQDTQQHAKNQPFSDRDILVAIETEFEFDPAVDGRLVTVAVQDGIVILTGKVDNLLARDRAAEVAGAIRGVQSVSNQITVAPIARTDKEIQNEVNRMIARNPTTESFQINASVNNGVVLITGKVDSWAEQDLATTVAKSIPGVREVRNKIEVVFAKSRPDKEIEADVRSRLIWDTLVDDELIFVDVKDGVVFLNGTVGSVMEQGRARSDAWVLGVKRIDTSGLEVKPWARDEMRQRKFTYTTDQEIAKAIMQAFLLDPRVAQFNPRVEVRNGEVILMGAVDTLPAKIAAEEIARNTSSVWRVRNFLKVRPAALPGSQELQRDVSAALNSHAYLDPSDINVRVRAGKIALNGTVNSDFEKEWAEKVAAQVKGVVAVDNNLTVNDESWAIQSDYETDRDIEQRLQWSAFVDESDVEVTVEQGVATLSGTVGSLAEEEAAIFIARQAGARLVRDDLIVRNPFRETDASRAQS
ncbi:MAG TPA: BON domain-containing protein [Candidatus Binatia bacterium]